MEKNSALYVIATPIGNLDDITARARRTISELHYFLVEDTREFAKLCEQLGIETHGKKVHSYAAHNMARSTEIGLEWLASGESVGVLTDRGTPAISDPGALIVQRAHQSGYKVVPIPGASAVTALVSASGLVDTQWVFLGFLPREQSARAEIFLKMKEMRLAFVFFESPKRIRETMQHLQSCLDVGDVTLGRELTKFFEEIRRVSLRDLSIQSLEELGEYAVLWAPGEKVMEPVQDKKLLDEAIGLRLATDREWSKRVADLCPSISASDAYNELQRIKTSRPR